jgi:hypothetical protein
MRATSRRFRELLPVTLGSTRAAQGKKPSDRDEMGRSVLGPGSPGHVLRIDNNNSRNPIQMALSFKRSLLIGLVGLGALFISTSAMAATDGTLGLSSTGTTDISIIKGDTAQITGLTDILLAPWTTGDPAPVGTASACVYTSTGAYSMTATSANGAGAAFRLTDGTNFIAYAVRWNDGAAGLQLTTNGTPLTTQAGDAASTTCGGATPATVQVSIGVGAMAAAPTGTYGDTLTVLIAPE